MSPDPVPHSGIGNAPCPLKWEQQNHRESGLVSSEVIREHKEGAPPSCQALLPYVWRLQTTMSGRNSRVVVQMCCRTPQPLTEFKLAPNFLKPKTFSSPSVLSLASRVIFYADSFRPDEAHTDPALHLLCTCPEPAIHLPGIRQLPHTCSPCPSMPSRA